MTQDRTIIPPLDLARIRRFADARVPPGVREQVRLEAGVRSGLDAVCDAALDHAPKAGDSAGRHSTSPRNHLAGRLGRIAERKRIKEDGTTEIVVPHTPGAKARRNTELRFARG